MKKIFIIIFILISLFIVSCQNREDIDSKKNQDNVKPKTILPNIDTQKSFSFRSISIGEPLENQLPECQSEWYKKTTPCYSKDTIQPNHYNIELLPDIGFGTVTDIDVINGNIERISTYTGDRDVVVILDLLQKKYGKPLIYNTEIIQNKLGAKFPRIYAQWKINNCDITLMNRVANIDDGYLIIETQKWQKQEKEKLRNREKEALDKL